MKQPGDVFPEESVLSGLTVEEVKAGVVPKSRLRDALEENGAPRVRVDPRKVEPMHAESEEKAFTRDGWLFELKLDGYRLIASKSKGEALRGLRREKRFGGGSLGKLLGRNLGQASGLHHFETLAWLARSG